MDETISKKDKAKKKKKADILHEKLGVSEEKREQLEDRLLRLAAEFDNYKKRTAREYEQLVKTANENLILPLVDVLDNFERALDFAKSAQDFDSFHQGVELIYQHLRDLLTREGLQPIEAMGHSFDPHQHEAVSQIEDNNHPLETVVHQVQRGYMLGDKLLRASRVVVSRRAEKPIGKRKKKTAAEKK